MKNNLLVVSLFLAGLSMGAYAMNRIQVKSDLRSHVQAPQINQDHAKAVLMMRFRNVYEPVNSHLKRNIDGIAGYVEKSCYTTSLLERILECVQRDIDFMRRCVLKTEKDKRAAGLDAFVEWIGFEIEQMRESTRESTKENNSSFANECIFGFEDDDMERCAEDDDIDRAHQEMLEQGTKKTVRHFSENY